MKKFLFILTVVILLALPLFSSKGYKEETLFSMDTVITLKIDGDKSLLEKAKNKINEIHNTYNAYDENSEVSLLNTKKEINPENNEIYLKAKEFFYATEGLFDPTVKPLTNLWNINGENPKVPEDETIAQTLKLVNGENLVIDEKISLENNASIDLGGIAKGYATDKIVEMLKKEGAKKFVLNLGGNIYAYSPEKAVSIGIQEPFAQRGELLFTVKVNDKAVVSSGIYERYFEENGKIYHHIFDTKTGYPAKSGISQVTIVGKDATMCDAFSTAILVGGEELALKLKEKYDFEYIILSGKKLIKSDDVEIFDIKDGYMLK